MATSRAESGCGCNNNKQAKVSTGRRPPSPVGRRVVRVIDHYHCSNPKCDYEERYNYPENVTFALQDTSCPKCKSEVVFSANEDRAMLVGFEANL